MTERLQKLAELVVEMDADGARREVEECLRSGIPAAQILAEGLSAGMRQVGEKFKNGEMYMPEVLVCCDIYCQAFETLRPAIRAERNDTPRGRMILGTIHGDIHTVGKDVAVPVFQAAGYEVIDLGVDVPDS
ncbi:MAG: B12-binding domain-containing protein, partial [Acidobacteriota bacterium]